MTDTRLRAAIQDALTALLHQPLLAGATRLFETLGYRSQRRVARQTAIESIEKAFSNNNERDYGRKLYLIENCIYGVDIQPVAAQIAKLRCFIALIVDQRVNDAGRIIAAFWRCRTSKPALWPRMRCWASRRGGCAAAR